MKKLLLPLFAVLAVMLFTQEGCYYDKQALLYPNSGACDTTVVKYSTSVAPIITANCSSCHSGNSPSGGFRLDSYAALDIYATNGKLWGAVSHAAGFSPMPKNAPQLSACNLNTIKTWLDDGHPNN